MFNKKVKLLEEAVNEYQKTITNLKGDYKKEIRFLENELADKKEIINKQNEHITTQNLFIESQNQMLKDSSIENKILKEKNLKLNKELLSIRGTNGGYAAATAKFKKLSKQRLDEIEALATSLDERAEMIKKLENDKKNNEKKINNLMKEKQEQNNIIQSLNEELKKIKNKKPTPTIEELRADQLFHGRRKK